MPVTESGAATAALELAARGWRLLPVKPDKTPRVLRGLYDATTSERAITNWFEMWPDTGIAVRTGDGLAVLDVDGDIGSDSLHALERHHGALPVTVSVVTGGGGSHYYFTVGQAMRNSAGQLAPGLDVRGDGGYVVIPPSLHRSGRRYEWDNHPADVALAPLPEWLSERLRPASAGKRQPVATWVSMVSAGLPDGQRNSGLARIAGHLLAKDVDARLVREIAQLVNTRCQPPLPAGEVDRIVASICGCELRKRKGAR